MSTSRYMDCVKGLTFLCFLITGTATIAGEKITYHHFDALGSPVAATNEQGNVIWRETYQPYGERIQKSPAAAGNTRWHTSHVLDPETGLQYAGARYYDPVIGRFMGVDPQDYQEGELHSFNRFAYGNNNPYRYLDPNGLWSTEAHNYFIDQAFSQMSNTIRGYIKEGSRSADALPNQILPGREPIHSMWGSGGSAETMQQIRSQYITEKLRGFADLMAKAGDYRSRGVTGVADNFERRAWIEYGKALHPIMDSTSPVHNKEWRIQDRHVHGDYSGSREDINTAPAYRDETVRRMHNMPTFISIQQ